MTNNKILSFDLDGTLLDNNAQISELNLKAIEKAKEHGIIIVFNSGRQKSEMDKYISAHSSKIDYVIANNGSYMLDVKTNQITTYELITKKLASKLFKIALKLETYFILYTVKGKYGYKNLNDESVENYETNDSIEYIGIDEMKSKINEEQLTQVIVRAPKSTSEIFQKKISKRFTQKWHVRTGDIRTAILPKNKGKLSGIKHLCEKLNISLDNVYAFGDFYNDLDIIKGLANGIAMENSVQELKDVAKKIIGSNESDAIAKEIELIIKM